MPSKKSITKNKLAHFMEMKECMTEKQKRRLIIGLNKLKEELTGNVGGETDIANADNFVAEDAMDKPERNVVAKTWDTKGDFDTVVNQRRGIEITTKELQALTNYRKARPTQQDRYFVKFENTDAFGNNSTVVLKKLQDHGQFCWTAFTTHDNAEDEAEAEGAAEPALNELAPQPKPPMTADKPEAKPAAQATPSKPEQPAQPPQGGEEDEFTVEDDIRIMKTVPFQDEVTGSDTLADFLNSGKLGI